MSENNVRVIKISKDALFEFVYEKFIEDQEEYFDVDPLEVTNSFSIDFESNEFIFCVYKSEDEEGNLILPDKQIDPGKIMKNIPDTTNTMFSDGRYKEFTKDELIALTKSSVDVTEE
ncbi:MAG: hypothetical protein IKM61_09630 [Eubacteriaceae bacterium]|nr:hypothetical protein [Eubacteriaceae bacterium]